jgi:hypothetical protein
LPFVCGLPENPTKKVDSHLLLSNEQITQLLTDVIKPGMKATEFKQVLKIKLKEEYPRAKTGATSINDFYSWLQLKGFIQLERNSSCQSGYSDRSPRRRKRTRANEQKNKRITSEKQRNNNEITTKGINTPLHNKGALNGRFFYNVR